MERSEYFEYFEEDTKLDIKLFDDETRFICNICNKSYSFKENLQAHIKSAHRGKRYDCEQCEYHAAYKPDLKRHIKAVHESYEKIIMRI